MASQEQREDFTSAIVKALEGKNKIDTKIPEVSDMIIKTLLEKLTFEEMNQVFDYSKDRVKELVILRNLARRETKKTMDKLNNKH